VRLSVKVDGDRPNARVPELAARTGTRFDTSSFTARGTWGAASDATSAIAGYQAQWSVDGGDWGNAISVGASSRSVSRTFRVGHAYALRVRARDAAGNWSPWEAADPFRATIVQDGSSTISTTGTWRRSTSSSWSGGSTRYAKARGASLRRTFTGRAVAIVAPRGPNRGAAQVWVDGNHVATLHLNAAHLRPRRVVFSRDWVASGRHDVRLVVLGTEAHPRVDFDALGILR
jgi:hypothetical protein